MRVLIPIDGVVLSISRQGTGQVPACQPAKAIVPLPSREKVERVRDDEVVVERERWQLVGGEPPCLRRIVAAVHPRFPCKRSEVHRRDGPPARVAARFSVHADEFEHAGVRETRLFLELASRRVFGTLALIHEAPGERPQALERLVAAPDEQHARLIAGDDRNDIGGESGAWILAVRHVPECSASATDPQDDDGTRPLG